jgi:hypothetical protein
MPAPDWRVLVAVQQWNIQTKAIICILSYGVKFVQGNVILRLLFTFTGTD